MAKFKCTVTREDTYEIEIDESKCNKEWMAEFRKHFFNFDTLEEHAEHIAQIRARFGESFIEGYGVPKINGKPPFCLSDPDSVNDAININIISEDSEVNVEVSEI